MISPTEFYEKLNGALYLNDVLSSWMEFAHWESIMRTQESSEPGVNNVFREDKSRDLKRQRLRDQLNLLMIIHLLFNLFIY